MAAANSLSGGLSWETWPVAGVVLIGALTQFSARWLSGTTATVLLTTSIGALIVISVAASVARPYIWWGLEEPAVRGRLSAPEVENLRSTRVPEASRQYWDRLQGAYETAAAEAERETGDSRVFVGPNNAGVSWLLNVNRYEQRCPVLWYDVCPDREARVDYERLQSDPPEVVIWNVPPEWVSKGHELAFRDGRPSTVRSINEWVALAVLSGNYRTVADIAVPSVEQSGERWRTLVLVREPSTPLDVL
jgi:hypothetical protein